jgi:hypothetical protein
MNLEPAGPVFSFLGTAEETWRYQPIETDGGDYA